MTTGLDTSRYVAAVTALLADCESGAWPRTVNKHAFYTALGTVSETPMVPGLKIAAELGRPITAHRKDGTTGLVPVGFVIAAKRASKTFGKVRSIRTWQAIQSKRGFDSRKLWLAAIDQKLKSMFGGRTRSAAFIRAGWVSVLAQLGPLIGGRYNRGGANVRGAFKGSVKPATKGNLNCTIINTAQARSEHRAGLIRHGEPALQRGIDKEANNMVKHLEEEMAKPAFNFNRH